jgi:hypothetical protein
VKKLSYAARVASLPFASQAERHGLEETVLGEGREDGVVVACGFRLAVSLEQSKHLVPVHPYLLNPSVRYSARAFSVHAGTRLAVTLQP